MESNVLIERASLSDQGSLFELVQKQFVEHEIEYSHEVLLAAIEGILKDKSLGLFLTAREAQGLLVGFAAISFAWTLEHGGKSAWLDELYVLPEYREKGLGSLLMDRVFSEAKKEGCLVIDLEVEEDHRRAERLYRRQGFEKLERSRWVRYL